MPTLSDFAAVLVDMDGTLVDSEPLWRRAERDFVAAHGHLLEPEIQAAMEGKDLVAAMRVLRWRYRLEPPLLQLTAELEARVMALLPSARALPGAAELVAFLSASGVPYALVSNSSHAIIDATLAGQPWAEALPAELRFSVDDVSRGKPDPELFLHAADALKADPERCLAIEDSTAGVDGALAAGTICFALPGPHADRDWFAVRTPYLFGSLHEVIAILGLG